MPAGRHRILRDMRIRGGGVVQPARTVIGEQPPGDIAIGKGKRDEVHCRQTLAPVKGPPVDRARDGVADGHLFLYETGELGGGNGAPTPELVPTPDQQLQVLHERRQAARDFQKQRVVGRAHCHALKTALRHCRDYSYRYCRPGWGV